MSDDRSDEGRLRDSWDANSQAWARAVRENRIESRRLGTDGALLDALVARGPGRLLDVGCGEGWLARRLSPLGFGVVGIDGSEALVAAARELGGGEFHVLAYEHLVEHADAVAGPFDYVVCNFSLLGDRLAPLLRAVAGRLGADGTLIIQTVHPCAAGGTGGHQEGWREEDFADLGGGFEASMPWYYRPFSAWIRELGAAGLAVADCVEPLHPGNGRPLSLLLVARPRLEPRVPARGEVVLND